MTFTDQQIDHALSLLMDDPKTMTTLEFACEHILDRSCLGEDDELYWREMTKQTNRLLSCMTRTVK